MADNLGYTVGSGATIRSEEKGGFHYQVVVLDIGTDAAEFLLTKGQAAMASSIPVAIASDQSAIPITVSGTVPLPTGASTEANQTTIIGHVDGIETLLTTIAGAVKAEDSAHSSTDVGIQSLGVANESNSAFAANGDYTPFATDTFGHLVPQIATPFALNGLNDTAETGSTTSTINATAHAVKVGDTVLFLNGTRGGTGYVTTVGANSFTITPPLRVAPNNGDFFYIQASARAAIDANTGNQLVALQTNTGAYLHKLEDSGHASGDPGLAVWAVRNDSAATLTTTDLDYSPFATDSAGRLGVSDLGGSITVDGTIAATQSGTWNVTNISGTVSLPTGAATAANQTTEIASLQLIDDTVHSMTDSQNKFLVVGGLYEASKTSISDGQVGSIALTENRSIHVTAFNSGGSEVALATSTNQATQITHESNCATSLGAIDDWDESDRCKVNPIVGQAGVQGGSGAVSALTQRVVLATDVALPAGTNIIGALSANQSVNLAQVAGTTTAVGNGTASSGCQRVTVASDNTPIPITVSSSSLTDHAAPAQGKIAGTSLTGTYANLITNTNANGGRVLHFFNSCNNTIVISIDGGTTNHFELETRDSWITIDLAAAGLKQPNLAIQAKHGGAAPTSGTIRCTVIK